MSTRRDASRLAAAKRGLVVALDGPGSSGKSTVGALAAAQLGLRFCDTGLFYRGVAWLALRRNVPLHDGPALAALVPEVDLEADQAGRYVRVRAAGADVTGTMHVPEIDRAVSEVARQPELRAALLPRQRALAAHGGIVMAGRDIGTVVLPDADRKIYLDASLEERARRRGLERGVRTEESPSDAARGILDELRARDALDGGRATAPMRPATDAALVQTDGCTLEQAVDAVVQAVVRSGRTPARDGP